MSVPLKQLQHYLDSKLKWRLQGSGEFEMSGLTKETLYTTQGAVLTWPKHPDWPQVLFPIMYPLSALTEPVLEGGKIPIVELLMLSYGYESKDINLTDVKLYYNDGFYGLSFYGLKFGFDKTDFSFIAVLNNLVTVIGSQLALYDQLYEWHFWLGDQKLFETGELIDKRTLK